MSTPLVALQPPKASVWQMYRAMVGIGIPVSYTHLRAHET